MEEKEPDHIVRPGVPEALDPDLGNGALWETNPHDFILKSVDPLHQLDNVLLDDEMKQRVLAHWNGLPLSSSIEKHSSEDESLKTESGIESETPEIQEKPIISSNKIKKTMEVEWAEDTLTPETESVDQQSSPIVDFIETQQVIEETTPKATGKVGKRVRKVVKKARDEAFLNQESNQTSDESGSGSEDVPLSPYTRWLKGLRGSEYVHPYDDDYALEQMSTAARGGVSETFADLLASQGHREKAIDMYMKLMEKYPEKSSFFAAKIEALK